MEHIRVLASEIGRRPIGSSEFAEAVAYGREQFEGWGYDVDVQEFPASNERVRAATLRVEGAQPREIAALPFQDSGAGSLTASLVDAGAGREEEFPADTAGAILLIQRLDVPFADMARRALDAGAAGAIVANKEAGLFGGVLDPPSTLPFVAIDQSDGEALRELLAAGPTEVSLRVDEAREVTAQNVVARPPGGRCRTVSGGHLDSVSVGAGATDNASGSAVVLELARTAAAAGLLDHCFVLFGAEEVGLVGSGHFVSSLSAAERDELAAMFNYDVSAGEEPALLIGDTALAEQALALAEQATIAAEISRLPEGASSDHASFLNARIPALMLSADGRVRIHTPEDTLANLDGASLGPVASLGFALLLAFGGAP